MAASAACKSSGFSSSAAIDAARTPSKRCVYSSTAASPRCCTSARISPTRASIARSCSADPCRTRRKAASKSVSAVDRRRMFTPLIEEPPCCALRYSPWERPGGSWPSPDRRGECVDDLTDRLALELERGLVDDQARRDLHDLFDLDEVVRLQRAAGGHEVDDGVGQSRQRRQLHRPVQLDQVHVHA